MLSAGAGMGKWITVKCPKCGNVIKIRNTVISVYCKCGHKIL